MSYYPHPPKIFSHSSASLVLYHYITILTKMSLPSLMHGFSFPTPEDRSQIILLFGPIVCQSFAVPILSPVLESRRSLCCHSFFFHGSSGQEIKAVLMEREATQKERSWTLRKCE